MLKPPSFQDYRHDDVLCQGLIFAPQLSETEPIGSLPGILLLHEYTGFGEYLFDHARTLAQAGYTVLCADMYGKGAHPTSPQEASLAARPFREDRLLMRARAMAGLNALAKVPGVDETRIGALGFSFGGCAALEIARCDTRLAAAVSVYGYLNTTHPAVFGQMPARLLVLHGAQDKVVPIREVPIFQKEMRQAGAQLDMRIYHDAGHGFCHKGLQRDDSVGSWYDGAIDERARAAYLRHFAACLS